jgi:peptidoglycan/LPS O-acetylase OafA/YrhL
VPGKIKTSAATPPGWHSIIRQLTTVAIVNSRIYSIQGNSETMESLLRKRMPELDFWRGTAIASVLLYHAIYWSAPNQPNKIENWFTHLTIFGWLGVNLFFVLSGFLITGILLDSKGKNGYFRSFYGRRVRRIVPAYALCLALLIVFHIVSVGGTLRAITFTANYSMLPAARSYAPLWSLSVEEQFYLVWPIIVLLASRRTLASICVGVCIIEPFARYFAWTHGRGPYDNLIIHGTLFVADSLALGALGALYFRSSWAGKRSAALLSASFVLLACVIFLVGYHHELLHRIYPVGAALQVVPFDLVFAAAIFASVTYKPRILNAGITRPVRALGDISYGLYLYHLIAFTIYDRLFFVKSYSGRFGELMIRDCVCVAISVSFAWISRWKFEEIFLRKKKGQFQHPDVSGAFASNAFHLAPQKAEAKPFLASNVSEEEV